MTLSQHEGSKVVLSRETDPGEQSISVVLPVGEQVVRCIDKKSGILTPCSRWN